MNTGMLLIYVLWFCYFLTKSCFSSFFTAVQNFELMYTVKPVCWLHLYNNIKVLDYRSLFQLVKYSQNIRC